MKDVVQHPAKPRTDPTPPALQVPAWGWPLGGSAHVPWLVPSDGPRAFFFFLIRMQLFIFLSREQQSPWV